MQHEAFAEAQEHSEFGFDFANWDFEKWFSGFSFDTDHAFGDPKKLVDSNFGSFSFDLVFRYEYVEQLWQHGGVKV